MTIESSLERIADALERIAAEGGAPAEPAKKAEKPAAAKKADKPAKKAEKKAEPDALDDGDDGGLTREDVRAKLKEYAALEGKDAAIKILNEVGGAATVSELDEGKFAEVVAALGD